MRPTLVCRKTLKEIKPDEREVLSKTDTLTQKLNAALKRQKIKAQAVVGGSIAKGTFLKSDHDCDVFVGFEKKTYSRQDISKILLPILKSVFKHIKLLHGSRDYFSLSEGGINYEIIPVLAIRDPTDAENITDCSPLHVAWVKKHRSCRDEIRLAKAFCKANRLYGAESYIKGFSGHVLDILTIHYGGFVELLEAALEWNAPQVIDTTGYHKGNALKTLNAAKVQSPLIVIDPVEPMRNAAANLSKEKFDLFIDLAESFLEKPTQEYFKKKEVTLAQVKKKAGDRKLITIDIAAKAGKPDVVGAKLLKTVNFIGRGLADGGFVVHDMDWVWNKKKKAQIYIITDHGRIAPDYSRQGPPLSEKEHVAEFMKKNRNTFTAGDRIFATIKRKHTLPEQLLSEIIKDKYMTEKVARIRVAIVSKQKEKKR